MDPEKELIWAKQVQEEEARRRIAIAGGELDTFVAAWKAKHRLSFGEMASLLASRIMIDGRYAEPATSELGK